MTVHLQRQLDRLKQLITELGGTVERAVSDAVHAVQNRDAPLARRVIEADSAIDQMEVDIEEECLHTLALHQPVAFDLRFIVSVLKINNDLERIADHAVSIAEQALFLAEEPPIDLSAYQIEEMARLVGRMLAQSCRAMVDVDADLAEHVLAADDRIDDIHRGMYRRVERLIEAEPARTGQYIHLLSLSRQFERVADLTVNIAEDVIYMARGQIMRHRYPA